MIAAEARGQSPDKQSPRYPETTVTSVFRHKHLAGLLALIASSLPCALAAAPADAGEEAPGAEARKLVESLEAVFVDVAVRIRPSVVMVEIEGTRGSSEFGALEELLPDLPPFLEPSSGTGSGFLVDAKGTVFTNNHVVQKAHKIAVLLSDGRRYDAELVGSDIESDVAVIRLTNPPEGLQPAELGDSDAVRVGQFAVAVGSPMGFQNSFTVGHVSAKGRSNVGIAAPGLAAPGFENLAYQDFLQVDTPINPGNSGGPLVDIHGRVIGINTAIIAGGGGGIGFSIPINMARAIADQLITDGRVRRGWLGVQPRDLSNEQRTAGIDPGAYVVAVLPDTPAANSGMRDGDVITALNSQTIGSSKDLLRVVAAAPIGKELACVVSRQSKNNRWSKTTLKVVLQERPAPDERRAIDSKRRPPSPKKPALSDDWLQRELGLALVPADKSHNRALKRNGRAGGVIVKKVTQGSLAEDAGLKVNDVLLEVNRRAVSTTAEVMGGIRSAGRTFVPLAVERDGSKRFLSIEKP